MAFPGESRGARARAVGGVRVPGQPRACLLTLPPCFAATERYTREQGSAVVTVDGSERIVLCISTAPDGISVAVGTRAGRVLIYDALLGERRHQLQPHSEEVEAISIEEVDGVAMLLTAGA